jgi:tRNA dimethylallyltransferase
LRSRQSARDIAKERVVDRGAARAREDDGDVLHRLIGEGVRGVAIAGPTASGKSALALDLAERAGGVVINADSMQVYRDLHVVTARPSPADEARAPHRLYGHRDGAEPCSAAAWAREAAAEIATGRAGARLPILVGGTGLYFESLFRGLSAIPPVPEEVRRHRRGQGAAELHAELLRRDPETAARLEPTDAQRLARALEVLDATGRSLSSWQAEPARPLEAPEGWVRVVLDVPRPELHARIARRAAAMLDAGAAEEVAALLARGLDPAMPVMRAIGVPELAALVRGEADRATTLDRLVVATRRYAKRQETWFRGRMPEWARTVAP